MHKSNRTPRKLHLGKETLRTLGERELNGIAGGEFDFWKYVGKAWAHVSGTCGCPPTDRGSNSGGSIRA